MKVTEVTETFYCLKTFLVSVNAYSFYPCLVTTTVFLISATCFIYIQYITEMHLNFTAELTIL